MKKFWIIFTIILGFIAIGMFSISLGKEETSSDSITPPLASTRICYN